MEVSELTLKLIIILIPGAVASIVFEKLTIHKRWNSFQFIAYSILFGGLSYLIAQLILPNEATLNNFWENLSTKTIPFRAVIHATIVSILLGFITSALDYYKVLNVIAKKLKVTNKYGDENLYSFFLNASNVSELYVRDITTNITYHGIIDSYSETPDFKELVLRAVKVYAYDTSLLMYEIDKIYLSKPKDNLIIEVPFINTTTNNHGTEGQQIQTTQ